MARRSGFSQVLVVGLLLAGGAFAGLVKTASEIYEGLRQGTGLAGMDQQVHSWFVSSRTPGLTPLVAAFSDSGGPVWMPVIAVVSMVVMAVAFRSWTPVVLILVGAVGSLVLTTVGKRLVGRERPPQVDEVPPHEFSPAFPSGHSLNSLVIIGLIVYLVLPHVERLAGRVVVVALGTAYVLAMGVSRVYLGHHWPSDVLMAWVVGAAWLLLVIVADRLWLSRHAGTLPPAVKTG